MQTEEELLKDNDILNTAYYVLKLLDHIVRHNELCTKDIPNILGISKDNRSAFRHFKTIKAFFKQTKGIDVFEPVTRGCYRVVNKNVLRQALDLGDKKRVAFTHTDTQGNPPLLL